MSSPISDPRTLRWALALRWLIILLMPAALVLTSVRLVTNEVFLWLEYHRPGFPDDPYGLSREERLRLGPYGVRYLLNDASIDYLARLELDGAPLFRQKELRHMEDVKTVMRAALRVQIAVLLILAAAIAALARRRHTRAELRLALSGGGVFTLGLILTVIVLALGAWDVFFDGFHGLFFAGDSWRFYNYDALIRLYPEQFWFDAALTIGALTVLGALALIGGVWLWERRSMDHNGATAGPVDPSSV